MSPTPEQEEGFIQMVDATTFTPEEREKLQYTNELDPDTLKPIDTEAYISKKATEYQDLRRAEYPSLAEQLDMQYHDLLNGTTTWQDTITEIKNRFPKN